MSIRRFSAHFNALASENAPCEKAGLGNMRTAGEPLPETCVYYRKLLIAKSSSKGPSPCQLKIFYSSLQPVQALLPAVTPSANKPLAAVPLAQVPQPSQAAALRKVPQSVRAQTCLPANRVPSAVTDASAAQGSARARMIDTIFQIDPARPLADAGFFSLPMTKKERPCSPRS